MPDTIEGNFTNSAVELDPRLQPRFRLTGGNIHDVTMAELMFEDTPGEAEHPVADKGYDSDAVREKIRELGLDSDEARIRVYI